MFLALNSLRNILKKENYDFNIKAAGVDKLTK